MKPLKEEPADKPGLLEPSITRLVIQGDDYQSLQGVARKNGLTINDFLAVALLGLAGEFNASLSRPSSYLCVLFTVNLRRFLKTTGIQIANISGISIFTSRQERAGSFKAAVNEVREKVGELKRHYLGLGFMLVPQLTTYLMPSLLMHAFIKRYGGFVLRQTARHALAMTNFGEMATCLDPFGDRLRNASAIAPIYDLPFPLLTVTGYRNRLTIFFAHLYRHEKDAGLGQRMAERMRYYLLEWPGGSS
jgi:NRPS condensation-like uncharacterized protein